MANPMLKNARNVPEHVVNTLKGFWRFCRGGNKKIRTKLRSLETFFLLMINIVLFL